MGVGGLLVSGPTSLGPCTAAWVQVRRSMWPDLGPQAMHLMLDWLMQFWEGGGARTQGDPLGGWARLAWNPCLATG